jgi:hypothetical protein
LRGANNRPGSRATAFKKGVHGGEVDVEKGAEGRLLQGVVVVVASQGCLPQEGHQVASIK